MLDADAHRRYLANTIEPSMCGGDGAYLPDYFDLFMIALWNRADHYIFMLWFVLLLLLLLFPRLMSAAAHCMSAILPHMVWP